MAEGTDVEKASDVPYQASIRLLENDRHLASGAILNVRFVVTQASFIWKLRGQYPGQTLQALARIRFGQVNLQSAANDQFQAIQSYALHPEFNFTEANHDLAVLKTLGLIEFNEAVQPISLLRGPILANVAVRYTDWGSDKDFATPDDYKPKLQQMDAIALSNAECRELLGTLSNLGSILYDSRVCIYSNETASVCTGNAGGPLVMFENGQPRLVAVMNFAYGACDPAYPAGFERLWNHNRWLVETATIDYKYANFGKMCSIVRNVAAQMLANKQRAVRERKAARDFLRK
ncbi:trypsin-1-like [Anopheles cruzii]|uniref:trypsin-1-like n=1 Tax=Anopheles cruzii TaxID=68878 RepID=UPI0022EC2186|nr:trypsin-1-like [Anopheles cruzii]